MSNYEDIYGKRVKELSADPTLNSSYEGQVWYNSTEGVLKSVVNFDSWSSTAPMGSGRYAIAKGTLGTQTAALAALGRKGGPSQSSTEEYNGTGWNTEGNANTARYGLGGFGTTSAFVAAGGAPAQNTVEEYNGSSWTTVTSLPGTARTYLSGFGTESAGAAFGGGTASPDTVVTTTNEYDGSSWTSGGALNTGGSGCAATGTQTAATTATRTVLPFNTASGAAEQYDGSSWTTITSVNTSRYSAVGFGTKDDMTICGGVPNSTATEKWDGSSWTTSPATLATGRNRFGGAGASSGSGLAFAGNPPGVGTTEEFNSSINTITAAAWASGPSINNARLTKNNGLGPTSASLIFGGNPGTAPYASNSTEEYDGSSWTNGGAYPSSASEVSGAAGTQTAALGFAQSASPTSNVANYDGTSWTVNPATFPTGSAGVGTGEQSAAIYSGNSSTNSLEWDNTSWTAGGTMNTARTGHGAGFGNTTSAMSATGRDSPTTSTADSEEYDGTTWTSVGNVITARKRLNASKPLSNASGYIFGGTPPTSNSGPTFSSTELWNGTNWSTAPNLGTATGNQFGAGTTDAFSIGGQPNPPITSATEIFTSETSAVTSKTLTSS